MFRLLLLQHLLLIDNVFKNVDITSLELFVFDNTSAEKDVEA